jgi:hypothetical protein
MTRAFRVSLFLLLTLPMSQIAMLVCSLQVLFGGARVLLALGVIAVCTENPIRLADVTESPKLAE